MEPNKAGQGQGEAGRGPEPEPGQDQAQAKAKREEEREARKKRGEAADSSSGRGTSSKGSRKKPALSPEELAAARDSIKGFFAAFRTLKDDTKTPAEKKKALVDYWLVSAELLMLKHAHWVYEYAEEINFGSASIMVGGYYSYRFVGEKFFGWVDGAPAGANGTSIIDKATKSLFEKLQEAKRT